MPEGGDDEVHRHLGQRLCIGLRNGDRGVGEAAHVGGQQRGDQPVAQHGAVHLVRQTVAAFEQPARDGQRDHGEVSGLDSHRACQIDDGDLARPDGPRGAVDAVGGAAVHVVRQHDFIEAAAQDRGLAAVEMQRRGAVVADDDAVEHEGIDGGLKRYFPRAVGYFEREHRPHHAAIGGETVGIVRREHHAVAQDGVGNAAVRVGQRTSLLSGT